MLDGERLAVHRVGQDRVRVPGLVHREAALEPDRLRACCPPRRRRRRGIAPRRRRSARRRGRGSPPAARRSTPRCSPRRTATARPGTGGSKRCARCRRTPASPPRACERMFCSSRRLSAERPLDQAAHAEPEVGGVEIGDREVVPHVEPRGRHDHAADQLGKRGLAVERMRPVDHAGRRRSRPGRSPRGRARGRRRSAGSGAPHPPLATTRAQVEAG